MSMNYSWDVTNSMDLPFSDGKALLLSPHFDDACYSVGGLLSKKPFKEVVNLTIFSKSQSAHLTLANSLLKVAGFVNLPFLKVTVAERVSKVRKKEDQRFCDKVGAVQKILPFEDTSLRGYLYSGLFDIEGIENEPVYNVVFRAIQKHVSSRFYDFIFCPLAIGNNIDHLIVMKAFSNVLKTNNDIHAKVFFYEDLPYASSYDLSFVDSLAKTRTGGNNPLSIDVTAEMPYKQMFIEIYHSQSRNETKQRILYHANRLAQAENVGVGMAKYRERCWVLDSY